MKYLVSVIILQISFLLLSSALYAQVNISAKLNTQISGLDSAKSVFGLDILDFLVINSSSEQVKIGYQGLEFKYGNSNWQKVPNINLIVMHAEFLPVRPHDSAFLNLHNSLFFLFYDDEYDMGSLFLSGGVVDLRVRIGIRSGSMDSVTYSPIVRVVLPPATDQDISALSYIMQQRATCPELKEFIQLYNVFSLDCAYIYEHLYANYPESALGKIAQYKISMVECRDHRTELNAMPELKASIIHTRDMLMSSGIPYLRYIAKNLSCADN